MSNSIEKNDFSCVICGSADCCERTNLICEPVLCNVHYSLVKLYQEYLLFKTIVRFSKIIKDK